MDASVTFRLPALATQTRDTETVESSPKPSEASPRVSDEALMIDICQGSREALAELFRRYAQMVRGVAYRILRDVAEADDLLQDTFLLLERKCRLFDPSRGPARSWIAQIAYRYALARRRHLSSRHFYTRLDLDQADYQLAEFGSNGEGSGLATAFLRNSGLARVFESLSDDQRETLQLFFVEGYSLPEIAAKLNQTHGNVKHHYFRGLEKLRKHVFNGKLRGNSAV